MKTTFSEAACPTPSPGGNHAGMSGGYPIADVGPGGQGLINSPFTGGLCSTPGGKETSSSELGTTPTLTDVKDGMGQTGPASGIGLLEQHQSDQTFKTGK